MIALIAHLEAKEGQEAAFETAFLKLVAAVRENEPANSLYHLVRSTTEPRVYKVLEIYDDVAALDVHRASEHYKTGGRAMRELCVAPPRVELFDTVD